MGACGSGGDKKKKGKDKQDTPNKEFNGMIVDVENGTTKNNEDNGQKLKNIPKKQLFNYTLIDLSTKKEFENQIESDATLGDLLKSLKLRENGDFVIEFDNNATIDNKSLNEKVSGLFSNIFNKKIPEIIKMNYTYEGLDISEDVKNEYIESNKIIGSAILDNQDIFSIITYERDSKIITPYYYKKYENENLEKFNLFTAFCNCKGNLYFSGGENEEGCDLDKTISKYNDFFYIDLTTLKDNIDKLIINDLPNLIESRTWHSMIYIPSKYIFIVGGSNTKSVEIFNVETKEIKKDSELNELRSECTLCLVNNTYLYAFCGFLLYQEHIATIEKCNLLKKQRVWDYVNLNEKNGINFRPSFFGVSYFKDDEILLIGSNDNGDEKFFDYIYKIGKNEEEKDEIDEFKCNLTENDRVFKDKLFLPINENESINIPLMIGEEIKIYILDTNKGEITIQNYQEIEQ